MNEIETLKRISASFENLLGERKGYIPSWYCCQLKALQNLFDLSKENYNAPLKDFVEKNVKKILEEITIDHHKDLKWVNSGKYIENSLETLEAIQKKIEDLIGGYENGKTSTFLGRGR